jgi:hypothetical protein
MVTAEVEREVSIHESLTGALVRSILENSAGRPWVLQELGLLALWLDERREYRLHVWDPGAAVGDPPIHDHPFDFTSTVIAGEMTNTRYEESASGVEYQRERYSPPEEQGRLTDTVRLTSSSTRFAAGQSYSQAAHELHSSAQAPGTITILRMAFKPVSVLTVCQAPGSPWVSGRSRPASARDVSRITAGALELMT